MTTMRRANEEITPRLVVVIEDEVLVREHAVILLEECGFSVADFGSADEALPFLESKGEEVDVIFTDVRLPGRLDGLGLAEIVARRWPRIPLVITSGNDALGDPRLPAGVTFLAKPWLPLDVLAHVDRVCRTSA
jgi:two-component system, response regulator PdtaR